MNCSQTRRIDTSLLSHFKKYYRVDMSELYRVDGVEYEAYSEGLFDGKTSWTVRKYIPITKDNPDDENNYVECMISTESVNSIDAIKAAIVQNSWA